MGNRNDQLYVRSTNLRQLLAVRRKVLQRTAVCSGTLRIGSQPNTRVFVAWLVLSQGLILGQSARDSLDGDQAGNCPGQILSPAAQPFGQNSMVRRVSDLVWPVKRPMDRSRADYCIPWLPPRRPAYRWPSRLDRG